jgi:cytochrome c peroxidase
MVVLIFKFGDVYADVTRCRTSRRRSWGRSCKAEDWGAARHTQRSKPRTAASLRTSTRSRSIRRSFEPTLSPYAAGPGKLSEKAARGKEIFQREDVGCTRCHSGPWYTDSDLGAHPFRVHDVGTGSGDTTEKMGTKYDTPTLIGVYRTAPYLHDGSALTLQDVLVDANRVTVTAPRAS